MWKKRVLVGMLAGTMLAGTLAGCNNGNTTSTQEDVKAAEGPFGKYEEMVEFNVARSVGSEVKFAPGEDIEHNAWADLYRDELGINLKYAWTVPENQYDQKVSLIIASKDIPDMMPVKLKDYYKLADAGLIEDMTEAFDTYASPLLKSFAEQNQTTMELAKRDGKLMAMPVLGEEAAANTAVLYIRKDWLEKLNLPIPTTLEEYLECVEAFAKNDPDGNGVADTFGMSISKELYNNGLNDLRGIFNAYHAYPTAWIEKDGGLVYGSVQPEMRTVLEKLQQLYKDGIIDTEFIVKDRFKVGDEIKAGKFGSFYGVGWAGQWAADNTKTDPSAEWIALCAPPQEGDTIKVQTVHSGTDSMYYIVKKGVKNREALIKMANLQAEMSRGERFNEETYKKYEFAEPENGESIMISKYAFITAGPTNTQQDHWVNCNDAFKKNLEGVTDPRVIIDVEKAMKYANEGNMDYISGYFSWVSEDSPFARQGDYIKNDQIIYDEFVSYPTETMITSESILEQKELEVFTKIITGDSIDLFDSFVTEWNNLGGKKITEEVNEWYKTKE